MPYDQEIAHALRTALPDTLHADIPVLAQVLADVANAVISQEAAAAHLAAPTFAPLLQALSGRQLAHSAIHGHITFGNISQGEGIAIGHGASANVIHIHLPPQAAPSPAPFMAPALPPHFLPRPDDLVALKQIVLASDTGLVAITGKTQRVGALAHFCCSPPCQHAPSCTTILHMLYCSL